MSALYGMRRFKNALAQVLATLATIFGLFWLVWIVWTTLRNGLASLNLDLFTQMTPPPGDEGGKLNAFYGSVVMSLLGVVLGAPVGVLAGTFLAEYSRTRWSQRLGEVVTVFDCLLNVPALAKPLVTVEASVSGARA